MVKRFRQVLTGFALRTRGGSTSKNRDAVQTPREARRRDLHRAGTWTGSESFVFAARNWEFSNLPVGFRVWIASRRERPFAFKPSRRLSRRKPSSSIMLLVRASPYLACVTLSQGHAGIVAAPRAFLSSRRLSL